MKITAEHTIKEGRRHRIDLEAREGGKVWSKVFYHVKPTKEWIDKMKAQWLKELQNKLEYRANPIEPELEDRKELQRIIHATVRWSRRQIEKKMIFSNMIYNNWFNKKFPDSLYSPTRIMLYLKNKTKTSTASKALQALAKYKFREID